MRLTKYMIGELEGRVRALLDNHTVIHELKRTFSEVLHTEMVRLQPKQTEYLIHLGQAPKVLSELVPRYTNIRVRLNNYTKEVAEAFAAHSLPEIKGLTSNFTYMNSTETVDLPAGKVLVGDQTFPSFNKDDLKNCQSWHAVVKARMDITRAEHRINNVCDTLPQVLAELRTLDAAMDKLPLIRAAVPESWLTNADSAKAPKSTSGVLDAESAARLRKIILGDRA